MTIADAKKLDLATFVRCLPGAVEVHGRGRAHEVWFRSPLRDERTASFKVDTARNKWMDFGRGEGGDVVDLARVYAQERGLGEWDTARALREIPGMAGRHAPFVQPAAGTPGLIREANPLKLTYRGDIDYPSINRFLTSRGLRPDTAKPFTSRVHFVDERNGRKGHGLGWENLRGGWEVRGERHKRVLGRKGISAFTLPEAQRGGVAVFEGMTDFLTYRQMAGERARGVAVVMNSAGLVAKASSYVRDRFPEQEVDAWLQNDKEGLRALAALKEAIPTAVVKNAAYGGYSDLNDYLLRRPMQSAKAHEAAAGLKALQSAWSESAASAPTRSLSRPKSPRL